MNGWKSYFVAIYIKLYTKLINASIENEFMNMDDSDAKVHEKNRRAVTKIV